MSAQPGWREIRGAIEMKASAAQAGEPAAPASPSVPDSYVARVLKLVPAEVVSLYVTIDALVRGAQLAPAGPYRWAAFAAGLIGTPYYLWWIAKVRKPGQIVLSTLSFIVWVLALGGPFEGLVQPIVGAILLVLFTFAVPSARV